MAASETRPRRQRRPRAGGGAGVRSASGGATATAMAGPSARCSGGGAVGADGATATVVGATANGHDGDAAAEQATVDIVPTIATRATPLTRGAIRLEPNRRAITPQVCRSQPIRRTPNKVSSGSPGVPAPARDTGQAATERLITPPILPPPSPLLRGNRATPLSFSTHGHDRARLLRDPRRRARRDRRRDQARLSASSPSTGTRTSTRSPRRSERFKEINEAYQVLSDPERRQRYDTVREGRRRTAAAGGAGFGASVASATSSTRSSAAAPARRARRGRPQPGADLRYDLRITFEEAINGTEKEIEFPVLAPCETCGGNGAKPGTEPITCPQCNGRGEVRGVRQTMLGQMVNVTPARAAAATARSSRRRARRARARAGSSASGRSG